MKARKLPDRMLLLCNGEPPSRSLVRALAAQADLVVAADGGANTARTYGVTPDIIIGDLDSIRPSTKRRFRSSIILHVRRQDNTDLEKALDFMAASGHGSVTVLGATGRRLDFTLGNLSVIWNYTAFLDITFRGDGWQAMPVGKSLVRSAPAGTVVSLIPFGNCDGITLRGLRYPLKNAPMHVGEIGVSNVVRSSPFSVRVKRGHLLLVILEKKRAAGGPVRW
jgi:thiamine pyrophosphokinase